MCHKVYNGKRNKGKAREKGLGQKCNMEIMETPTSLRAKL
jgi:hypothetical protein